MTLVLTSLIKPPPLPLQAYRHEERLMGNQFVLTVVSEGEVWARERLREAREEIARIEQLLTTFDDHSQTNRINAAAGLHPVKVDREVFNLIERSLRISALTQGAFDITYGGIDKRFWNFDRSMKSLPPPEQVRQTVRLVNYRNILLDAQAGTVMLREKGMRIGFGGIGKGYAADRARQVIQAKGVHSGIINASGDLIAWGAQPNGRPWTIGVVHPQLRHLPFAQLELHDLAVATSGDYEKYVMIAGKRYSHTIDPKTGYPVSGISSVTVIAPTAELADALTTPVMVMGIRTGLNLIDQIKGLGCIIVDDQGRYHFSKSIKLSPYGS